MKSKAEEIKQFKLFLGRLEKGGYLDNMFSTLLPYVERQIADDFSVDIQSIIQGFNDVSYDLKQANESIENMEKSRDGYQADYERGLQKLTIMEQKIQRLEKIEVEVERLQLLVTELREENGKLRGERDQLDAQVRTDSSRVESGKKEIVRLKGKLFDYFEEIQALKKKLGLRS